MISFKDLGRMGRCGNQLFQMAATISLAIDNNVKYIFPRWSYEERFSLCDCFSDQIEYHHQYHESSFCYKPIPFNDGLNLSGYFQSERYFENNKEVILGLLTPQDGLGKKWDTTSIHVRRGDYLNLTREYEQLNMDYYQRAMELIGSKKYIIVSDDIEWCKKHFVGEQFEFSQADEITDLNIQISCANNIIANSSFSWWGAYLNKNPSKIVVAPQKWFGPALPHDTKDLIPKEWIKI